MAFASRSKRPIKKRVIYSPSDSLEPDYYLVHVKELEKYIIAKKSGIKEQSDGTVFLSIAGKSRQGDIITTGSKSHCDAEFRSRMIDDHEEESDNDSELESETEMNIAMDKSSTFLPSSSAQRRSSISYSKTPQLPRSRPNHYTANREDPYHDDNNLYRSRSNIQLYNRSPSTNRAREKRTNEYTQIQRNEDQDDSLSDQINKAITSRIDERFSSLLTSIHKKMDFLTKKIHHFSQSSGFEQSQLSIYRNEKDVFDDEVVYGTLNLLDIGGKNPGDYGRRLLRILYSEDELKTSMLPSTIGHRYSKPKLDGERFALLNKAMRAKYRISEHHYDDFYKTLVRKKLSDFLLEEERRDRIREKRYQRVLTGTTTTPIRQDISLINNGTTTSNDG